jgi:hypothetical protein
MQNKESRKAFLTKEIQHLTKLIELARKSKRDCPAIRKKLVELILELDSLGDDEESQESE